MEQSADAFGILDRVRGAVGVCSTPAEDRTVGEWMDLIGDCSRALTIMAAARDAAIVRLAAIDEIVDEDGVVREKANGLGTTGLDAGAMVSTATGTSAVFGEEMVEQAITRVVRVPALHEAMVDGILDDYKARCVASELTDVPPDLGRTVMDALSGDLSTKSGPALRKRTRDILFRLSPDLLRTRLKNARKQVGLRRWVGEPGTDRWGGSFPSESAAQAWAAIDALARQYRLEGTYPNLEMARAHALLDLVNGNATVEAVLHLTVPADVLDGQDTVDETTPDPADETTPDPADETTPDPADETTSHSTDAVDEATPDPADATTPDPADAVDKATPDPADATTPDPADVTEGVAPARSGPRPSHESPQGSPQVAASPSGSRAFWASGTFVGAAGVQGSTVTWMRWRSGRSESMPWTEPPVSSTGEARSCHPATGGLLDVGDLLASSAYRPGERLKAVVRQRDGRCRFPGCAVSARSCDLDHVLPWPNGPTSASNLICLCRRHHRVKQRHRWRVTLCEDGTVEWTDPSGRVRTTAPVDHLGAHEIRAIDVGDLEGIGGIGDIDGVDDLADIDGVDDLADIDIVATAPSGDTFDELPVNQAGESGGRVPPDPDRAANRLASGDAPHRLASGDAPHRLASGDAPHRLASGDAPHRLASGGVRWGVSRWETIWTVRAEHHVAAVRAEARAGRRSRPTTHRRPMGMRRGGRAGRITYGFPTDDLGVDVRLSEYYPFGSAAPVSAGADAEPPF